ncbi:hypothetical protein OG413_04840 [Streptomyces sp. NBC_01433]|uniref:hypothetical protein n=1 Tax=Streptomyces sp. NBC_01433 TaxID=2903864 RepID=UPI00224C9DD9|nr:hypothetical protein [Streptomyces sp. NBC_01433]MCX4674654.1 hypothetical protein [Streptomyces sp. NBC_01433]
MTARVSSHVTAHASKSYSGVYAPGLLAEVDGAVPQRAARLIVRLDRCTPVELGSPAPAAPR